LTKGLTGQISCMFVERPVVKRTARAILLAPADTPGSPPGLIVIKRTKPGQQPYWITPGGGMEPDVDRTVVEALHREVAEELGAEIADVVPAFVDTVSDPAETPGGVKVQHFFVCRLVSLNPGLRHGPEVEEPQGEYDIVRLPFTPEGITSVDVVPATLRAYLTANIEGIQALLARDLF
jgi:ADP-ribose pyrophosphatase YjhB (NUDIX family)